MKSGSSTVDVALQGLVGRAMTSVTFVMDYLQIAFDEARITALTTPELLNGIEEVEWNSVAFANILRQQIGKLLHRADVSDRKVRLTFNSGIALSIPLTANPPQVEHLILEENGRRIWVA